MKCKNCSQKTGYWVLPIDLWGNPIYHCYSCGISAKKVPFGDPDKWWYLFMIVLWMFGIRKTLWIEKEKD